MNEHNHFEMVKEHLCTGSSDLNLTPIYTLFRENLFAGQIQMILSDWFKTR